MKSQYAGYTMTLLLLVLYFYIKTSKGYTPDTPDAPMKPGASTSGRLGGSERGSLFDEC